MNKFYPFHIAHTRAHFNVSLSLSFSHTALKPLVRFFHRADTFSADGKGKKGIRIVSSGLSGSPRNDPVTIGE